MLPAWKTDRRCHTGIRVNSRRSATLVLLMSFAMGGISIDESRGDPCQRGDEANGLRTASWLGDLEITLLSAVFWRDWMPEVEKPGPDGGSALHAKIRLLLDNSKGGAGRLHWGVVLCDEGGRAYSVAWESEPVRQGDSKDSAVLFAGQVKTIELVTRGGPYLPSGSKVFAVVRMKDHENNFGCVWSRVFEIRRAD